MVLCGELGFYGIRFEDAYKHLPRRLSTSMTSNNTPRGVAIAGTDIVAGSYDPWMAFDNNNVSRISYFIAGFTGAALNEEQYLGWYDTSLSKKENHNRFFVLCSSFWWIN